MTIDDKVKLTVQLVGQILSSGNFRHLTTTELITCAREIVEECDEIYAEELDQVVEEAYASLADRISIGMMK